MKRFLAILCTLAMLLSILPSAAFAAENSDLQVAMDDVSSEIIVLEEDTSNLTVNRDTTIDLNGHDLDSVSVLAGTLYIMDSATADYTVADGIYGHVTNVTGAVKAAEGYLQVGDSFHAVNLDIYAMTLRAADVGVYYKSHFAADEIVAAEVESFGVALSVVTAPSASNLETYCGYSAFTGFAAGEGANSAANSTLLKGIMKAANGDEKNAKNAAMPVYGRAYIKTSEGYFFGETVKRSLQEQVEAIDGVWETLSDAQKAPVLSMLESYTAVMENWEIPNIQGIQTPGADEEIEIPIEVTAENGVVTETVTVEQNGVSITVPAGTKLAEGAKSLTLTITPVEAEDTGLTLKEDRVLIPMDVHVEGLAADNAQPLTIYLGKVMPENLNMGNYAVYHVENGSANEMTLIPVTAEFTAHNQYKYTLDGELTLYIANFSLFAAAVDEKPAWQGGYDYSWYTSDPTADTFFIRNADQLAAFGAIVGGMATDAAGDTLDDSFKNQVVTLLADIDLGDANNANKALVFHPIGYYYEVDSEGNPDCDTASFRGTFDGNGHTIANFYQDTWGIKGDYNGNYYDEAMGLFAGIYQGTVKNLTVKNFSCDGEFTPAGVIAAYADQATFENITISHCNPRVYNTGNGGIVGIGGHDTNDEEAALNFTNITIDNTNKISALWGSWDVACGGLIGMFYGKGYVNMTNCHVAAQIDVNNDVCGNYQYYWYRYSGMLIGTNTNMTTNNGYTVPEISKFKAENCTVHFGDWNNYWYCELVANTQASYTHDHQMSRLVRVAAVDATNMQVTALDGTVSAIPTSGRVNYVVVTAPYSTENATCYHFVDGKVHDHDDYNGDGKIDYETVNGQQLLVENNRHIYLPFNQLVTGYGWGVKHIPIYNDKTQNVFPGVTILDQHGAGSVKKFAESEAFRDEDFTYPTGTPIKLGDLFKENDISVPIMENNLQVTISPADETSKVAGTYTPYTQIAGAKNWTEGTLLFDLDGEGWADITITDYYFCETFTLRIKLSRYQADLYWQDIDAKLAFCPVCKANVTWNAVDPNATSAAEANKHHFLSEETTYSGTGSFMTSPGSGKSTCFHLNGQNMTITSDYALAWSSGGTINVMGDGQVTKMTGTPAGIFHTNTGAVGNRHNIYGGRYINKKGAVISVGNNGGVFYAYSGVVMEATTVVKVGTSNLTKSTVNITGAELKGNITIDSPGTKSTYVTLTDTKVTGTVTVTDKITATDKTLNLTISGSTVIPQLKLNTYAKFIPVNLTEGANIKVNITGLTNPEGALTKATANANAKAALPYVFAYDNSKLIYEENGQLYCRAKKHTDNLVFPDGDKQAYCTVCKKVVTWTGITSGTRSNAAGKMTGGKHWYLTGDTIFTANEKTFINLPSASNSKVENKLGSPACFHLNGYDLTATGSGSYLFEGSSGQLNILGSGNLTNEKSYVLRSNTIGFGFFNLYSGTYNQGANSKTAVLYVGGTGGKFVIHEDVEINAKQGNAIQMGAAGLRKNELSITGATINGNITIENPKALKDEDTEWGLEEGYNSYLGAGIVEFALDGAKINGTVTLTDKITAEGKYLSFTVNGATTISKVVLHNNAKMTLGELGETTNIVVSATGAENKTITSADSGKIVYCENGVIIVEAETATEPETPTEPEEGTEEETTGA